MDEIPGGGRLPWEAGLGRGDDDGDERKGHDMNPLLELAEHGQSYWLDNLTRDMIRGGELARRVHQEGLRGVTSNPSIFHKAISGGATYDEQIAELARAGAGVAEIYERLVVDDIRSACDVLRPVFDDSGGVDGFISLEVSPYLVHDTEATIDEARRLFAAVDRPNVFIKIPGSPAGYAAIESMLTEGVNVNITLLFSIEAYEAVAEAYLRALERRLEAGQPVDDVASVASFFLSRIDVLVDSLLGQRIRTGVTSGDAPRPEQLLGRAAVANAKLAYESFTRIFGGERWQRLADAGARVQRVLWASTSTKNPLYSDVRYIEPLIGPHTVNTLPDESIAAFADHGTVRPGTVAEGVDEARRVMDDLSEVGIDFDAVTWQLLNEGMEKFTRPYDALMRTIQEQRREALGAAAAGQDVTGIDVGDGLEALDEQRFAARLAAHDPTLWTLDPETADAVANRLGWLDAVAEFRARAGELTDFAREVRDEGVRSVVLLGMGGSSLCPEMCAEVFGPAEGWPELLVLDSTDPEAVAAVESAIDVASTLFVVSSKSGTTTETLSFFSHFFALARDRLGDDAGGRFVAVTDPGSPLEEKAGESGFRRVFTNPEDIGGRYSALSYFGLVPMALLGMDVADVLDRALAQLASCAGEVPPDHNPGLHLGAVLGLAGRAGRDKITFVMDDRVAAFGWWLEQLLAESTGKEGTGLLPVEGEPLGDPSVYGDDRVFVSVAVGDGHDHETRELLAAIADTGQPLVRIRLDEPDDLGAEFVRWEVATATAGAILGINPFDEPNVAESKSNTRHLLEQREESGGFDEPEPTVSDGSFAAWTGSGEAAADSVAGVVRDLLDALEPGRYLALLPYFRRTDRRQRALQALREAVRDRRRVATTLGYGPRYLHSTGQLHKGGPDTGSYLVLTADPGREIAIPDRDLDFGTLLRAQALGDFRALADHGRRVVRVHLGRDLDAALESLVKELV